MAWFLARDADTTSGAAPLETPSPPHQPTPVISRSTSSASAYARSSSASLSRLATTPVPPVRPATASSRAGSLPVGISRRPARANTPCRGGADPWTRGR